MLIRILSCLLFTCLSSSPASSQINNYVDPPIEWTSINEAYFSSTNNQEQITEGNTTIEENESITVFVPNNSWLQIDALKADLDLPIKYQASISKGLAYQLFAKKVTTTQSLISPESKNRLVTLFNDSSKQIEIALFTGQKNKLPQRFYNQVLDAENLPTTTLIKKPLKETLDFRLLEAHQKGKYLLEGPAFLKVTSLVTNNSTHTKKVAWQINATINDQFLANWHHKAIINKQYFYTIEDSPVWGTAEQNYYLKIPKGEQKLELYSPSNSWLKVEKIANDFLFPSNKEYLISDEQAVIEQLFSQQSKAQGAIEVLSELRWLEDPKNTLDKLMTQFSQEEAALAVESYTDLFFRETPPKESQSIEAIYLDSAAQFWQANYAKDGNNPEAQFISTIAAQDSLSKKVSQSFFKLTKQQTMTFELPKERLLSDVKIKLYNPQNLAESVQISSDSHSFIAYLQPDDYDHWPVSQNLKEAVTQLRNNEQLKNTKSSSDIAKKQHSELIFKASDQDSSISITGPAKGTVYIALSYITPQQTTNNQQQWLILFVRANSQGKQAKQNKTNNIEVSRLHQLLTKRSEQFTHGVQCEPVKQKATTITRNKSWLAEAELFYAQGLTEELANLLFNVIQYDNDISLWQWRLKLLRENGLWSIYSQVLKGLSCDKRNIKLQQYAQKIYAEYKLQRNDHMVYEQLLAYKLSTTELSAKNFEHTLYEFALVLFNQGKYRASLASLTLLPLSDKTAQLSLWLAKELSSWQLYQYFLTFVDTKHLDFYLGLQAFEQTNYSKAMAFWRLDENEIPFIQSTAETFVSREFAGVIVPETYDSNSISTLTAKSIMTAYTAAIPSGIKLMRTNKKHPLKMTVNGPLTIKLMAWQLKTAEQKIEDDWLLATINDTTHYIPINKSSYTSTFKLKGSNLRLGKRHYVEYSLPAGEHQLSIAPQQTDMLININSLTTRLPDVRRITKSGTCNESQHWQLVDLQGQFVDTCLLQPIDKVVIPPTSSPRYLPNSLASYSSSYATAKLDPINTLSQEVFLWESAGKENDIALVNIQLAIMANQDNHLYHPLKRRMSQYVNWHLLQPTLSAGNKVLHSKPLTFQSPIAMLSAISKNYDANVDKGKLFKSFETLYFDLKVANNEQVKLRIRSYMSPHILLPFTQLNMKINGKVPPKITLKQNDKTDIKLNLKSGDNHISLNLAQAYSQQFFTAEILVKSKGKAWRIINNIAKRKIHLSGINNKLSFYLSSPSLLRIDKFNKKNEISSRYHYQSQSGNFSITASEDNSKLGYRVYQMNKADENKVIGEPYQMPAAKETPALSRFYLLEQNQENLQPIGLTHRFDPDRDTWGGYYHWRKRLNLDEGLTAQSEYFNEVGFQQRNFSEEKQRFWRFDVLARRHNSDHKVLGINNYLDWRLEDSSQLLHTKISAFYQLEAGNQEANWSAGFNVGWQRNDDWFDKLDNQLDISIFGQSVADLPVNRQYWDNDIYSAYKNVHENGANISNRLRYVPYQDAELAVSIAATTNPIYQKASIDSAAILLSGKLYWRSFTLATSYTKKYFFADDDRLTNDNRARWSLGLQHRYWQRRGQLWRLHADFSYDVTSKETSLNLKFSWNATQNKGVTDFRLKEVPFRDLHQQQAKNSIYLNEVVAK